MSDAAFRRADPPKAAAEQSLLGRGGEYLFRGELAQGGMATVHLGCIRGAIGFVRAVAIKRLHAQYAKNENFVAMLIDEARLMARIRHANVVPILDVVSQNEEIYLIMDFVHGVPMHRLFGRDPKHLCMPAPIAGAILVGALAGLHAAHEARDEQGQALGIVHRDVSPQNIIVGKDGVARLLDFGVAKARGRLSYTQDGVLKGKFGYMSPEQLRGKALDRRSDVYACGVVLWEALVGQRMIDVGEDGGAILSALETKMRPPSALMPDAAVLDDVVLRALEPDPAKRFASAAEMAAAIERSVALASHAQVSAWVCTAGHKWLEKQVHMLETLDAQAALESSEQAITPPPEAVTRNEVAPLVSQISNPVPQRRRPTLRWFGLAFVVVSLVALAFLSRQPAPVAVARSAPSVRPNFTRLPAPAPPPSPAPLVIVQDVPSPAKPRKPHARPKAKPADTACEPPYTVNADGIRKYKPQCL
ncbi:MAG: serine/threonine-protein kinase [Deltaproteobacteria bacterium]|nr:serine/threonine-protein kinase [Deltaproteobacteria bacterium]